MLSLYTNLITNNFNNDNDMFAAINSGESDATYFDKINLSHYNDNDIIKVDIENPNKDKLFNVCEIIARLNNFTEAERKVYYYINKEKDITVSKLNKLITANYSYSNMTVKRSLDKFINCGVIRYKYRENSREVDIKLNDSFNVAKYIENSDSDILIAVNLKL